MEYLVGAYSCGGALAVAAGGVVRADWTRVQEVPAGRGRGGGACSGGAVAAIYKTLAECGADGIILFRGPALCGRGSEIEYL